MPINFANVHLTLRQFHEIAKGKYNAGEVRLAGEDALEQINHHVHMTLLNRVSLSQEEVLAIKDAFVKVLSQNGVTGAEIARVRQELGLEPKNATDLRLRERSIKPLSRQQIREILDRNAQTLNHAQTQILIQTDGQIHAAYSQERQAELAQKRLETNRGLPTRRATVENLDIALAEAVLSGDVDFYNAPTRQALLEVATRQKATILERSHGHPAQALDASLNYNRQADGFDIEFKLGMSEAAYIDKLDDMILRLTVQSAPGNDVLAARNEFDALKNSAQRTAWIDAQANAPNGGFKVRTAAVMILHGRGVDDYEMLSLVNRLSDADARALLAVLVQLPKDVRGAALRNHQLVVPFAQRPAVDVPAAAQTFVPSLSPREFNVKIKRLIDAGGRELPHRFKTMLEEVKAGVLAHFGADVLPANFALGSLSPSWGALIGFDDDGLPVDNAPAITPDMLRQRVLPDAAWIGARRFLQHRVAALLAEAGGDQSNAAGVANNYLQRDPAFFGHLAAAQSPEAAQAVFNEAIESIRAAVHLHVVCAQEKAAFVTQCREMFAREMGISVASLEKDEAVFSKAATKATSLVSQFVTGERVAGSDDDVRAAFRQLATEHVTALVNALHKTETLELPEAAKDAIAAQLLHTADPRLIDLDAVAGYAGRLKLSTILASLDANAPKEEIYGILNAILQQTEAMTSLILRERGVHEFGAPELYCFRALLLAMAGGAEPDFVARLEAFASRPDVRADDIEDTEKPSGAVGLFLSHVRYAEGEGPDGPPFRVRVAAANAFAPEGAATQRALQMGYFRPEMETLRRTAELYQAATGCTLDEAVDVALDHTSAARRLFSYGGRFIASVENFKAGLKLMNDFTTWFTSTNAQVEAKRESGQVPVGAGATILNVDTSYFHSNGARAYERFLFEEIAVNEALPLKVDDPERIFGMAANPATRFIGRGYTRSSANTLAQIPPERRSVLYAVLDVLSPLGATEAESRDNNLSTTICEITARVMRHYDAIVAMKAAGQLTRENILTQFFPDIENGPALTNRQLSDYYVNKMLYDIVPNRLGGNPALMGPIMTMVQQGGARLNEAVNAALAGQNLPLAPFFASANGDLEDLNGTAEGGRKTMFGDLHRPNMPTLIPGGQHALAQENCVFKVVFPDGTVLKSKTGPESHPDVMAASNEIANKIAQFCGNVHPDQLGAIYYALSQAGASNVNKGLVQYHINSSEHAPLTYTFSKDAETGAVTIRYSEPEGLPVRFHWKTVIQLDGSSTSTAMTIDA